jgi:hypothetical protein
MPELNSTPEGATAQATVPTEELIRSDAFLDEIMGSLAKTGQEPLQRLESSNRQEAVDNQNREVQAAEAQVEAQTEAQPAEGQVTTEQQQAQENSVATPQAQQDPIEKRWRDAQAMIGRQSNEIGQLRKKLDDAVKKMETPTEVQAQKPWYENLLNASEENIAQLLLKEAQAKGEELDPFLARQHARLLQTNAKMQLDIINDKLRPFEKVSEEMNRDRLVAQKDAEWKDAHPEHESRKQAMNEFIKAAYPDGLRIKNDMGEVIGMRADPYEVAHMAYEYAGRISKSAQTTAETLNNQRIATGRSLNAATQGTVPSQAITQKPKLDALEAETSRVFEQVAPQLIRGAR